MATRTKAPSAPQATVARLARIAQTMRETVSEGGAKFAHHRQQHGLELVLQRQGRGWRLALGRQDVPASDTELLLWRMAFGVPEGAEVNSVVKPRKLPKTGQTVQFFVTDVTWVEVEA